MNGYKTAIKDMEDMISRYKWTHDKDPEMLAMYKEDRKDFKSILSSIKKANWEKACDKAYYLDTAAREAIPGTTWYFMQDMRKKFC